MTRTAQDEERQVEQVRQDLLREYAGAVGTSVVDEHLTVVIDLLRPARVRDFVPTLVHSGTRERLRRLVNT